MQYNPLYKTRRFILQVEREMGIVDEEKGWLQKSFLSYNRVGYFDGTEALLKISGNHLGMWHIPEIICSAPEFHQVRQDNLLWLKFCEESAERIQQWRVVH